MLLLGTKYMEMKLLQRKVLIDKESEIQGIKMENDVNKLTQASIDCGAKHHVLLIINGKFIWYYTSG